MKKVLSIIAITLMLVGLTGWMDAWMIQMVQSKPLQKYRTLKIESRELLTGAFYLFSQLSKSLPFSSHS